MNGLELSLAFFEQHGKPMLEEQFSSLLPFLAVGLLGAGSECFGYDDAVSQDHDFEPAFCIFLPGEEIIDRRSAFLMERAYSRLPRSFMGYDRPLLLPVGGARHGVLRTGEFFLRTVGSADGTLSLHDWLTVPEQALAEATNGKLFFDHYGEVSQIRKKLEYFPEDIVLKRIAGQLLLMAQSGQYNYGRCLAHGEPGAAQLAAVEFVKSCMSVIFLLNRRYQPYYKWSFRALRELSAHSQLAEPLLYLITSDNSSHQTDKKAELIEDISNDIVTALKDQNLSSVSSSDLERHAYSVNDRIKDPTLRNMHILAAI